VPPARDSGPLTTKEPTKIQAITLQGLHFRRLFRRQHAAGFAGRWSHGVKLLISGRLRDFVSSC
jgi:hypothetical protein